MPASTRFCRRSGCGVTINAMRSGEVEWAGVDEVL
jgi:hypothetical protein